MNFSSIFSSCFYLLRHNYFGFDPKLNVIRVSCLMEEVFGVFMPNSNHVFFSIDVVRMFDKIPMSGVLKIVERFLSCTFTEGKPDGTEFHGCVNFEVLRSLIEMDCQLFDFFRYTSPAFSKNPKPRYFHQLGGIPMGGNTSNLYADLYLSYHLHLIQAALEHLGVKLIRKYVDDLLIYAPKENIEKIVALIVSITRLEFTVELPSAGRLPYLDMLIINDGDSLRTTW